MMKDNRIIETDKIFEIAYQKGKKRLDAAYDRIDDGDLTGSRQILRCLEKDVGIFPELQEIKSYLDRLEMLADRLEMLVVAELNTK